MQCMLTVKIQAGLATAKAPSGCAARHPNGMCCESETFRNMSLLLPMSVPQARGGWGAGSLDVETACGLRATLESPASLVKVSSLDSSPGSGHAELQPAWKSLAALAALAALAEASASHRRSASALSSFLPRSRPRSLSPSSVAIP